MTRFFRFVFISLLVLCLITTSGIGAERPRGQRYWIFFRDKGVDTVKSGMIDPTLGSAQGVCSPRRCNRISRVAELMNNNDLPVCIEYMRTLKTMGVNPYLESKWLNGVSAELDEIQLERVKLLPFVRRIQSVSSYSISLPPHHVLARRMGEPIMDSIPFDYGASLPQVLQIRVPELHAMGINGTGILVGMLDTGFDFTGRTVFEKMNVEAEYDFHFNDTTTANEDGDVSTQQNHGTRTLSVIGGFHEGFLIGPAYGSSYALAKTEWLPSETNIEEDHWVVGLEWLESMGVDVVSSSLGYSIFDSGYSYTYEDMDGNTAVTTLAADMAAARGVVVVTSAGNEGGGSWKYVTAPADGDSVIAVGAVSSYGDRAYFSSLGPTYDGRIKPDVMAMGVGVQLVNTARNPKPGEEYSSGQGTSYACPLVAGVCAQILQAHPELGPIDVREALRQTADHAATPDTDYGWGLIDAYEAVFYHGPAFTHFKPVEIPGSDELAIDFYVWYKEDLVADTVYFSYKTVGALDFTRIQAVLQDEESHKFRVTLPAGTESEDLVFFCEAEDISGRRHTAPIDAPVSLYELPDSSSGFVPPPRLVPGRLVLHQNYPNPFNQQTMITFEIEQSAHVRLMILDVRGREVARLIDGAVLPGIKQVVWNTASTAGGRVSSGLYLCVLETNTQRRVRKVLLSR